MTAIMEHTTSTINYGNKNLLIGELSIQQIIELAIDSENEQLSLLLKQELVTRGKDNIQARIIIKKCCKSTISDLEGKVKTLNSNNNKVEKEKAKLFKNKFLTSISVLDKLQLEWQKHDLSLKH